METEFQPALDRRQFCLSSLAFSTGVTTAGATFGVSLALLYWRVLVAMVQQWWQDPNWSHGFMVPFFTAFLLWHGRKRWRAVEWQPSWLGLAGVVLAIVLLLAGSLAAELLTTRFSFLLMLGALVVYLAGWRKLRLVAFPLGYLALMIPWPAMIYAQVTLPLQFLASRLAAWALEMARVPVLREGNLLYLANYTLEVADACSGIRSLVSLITLAVAYAYLAEKRWWIRIALTALMAPIAVASNGFRIFGTGELAYRASPRLAEGFFHEFSGWLIFLSATGLMLALHWILRKASACVEAMRG